MAVAVCVNPRCAEHGVPKDLGSLPADQPVVCGGWEGEGMPCHQLCEVREGNPK